MVKIVLVVPDNGFILHVPDMGGKLTYKTIEEDPLMFLLVINTFNSIIQMTCAGLFLNISLNIVKLELDGPYWK
jgi:hypothetical protein